MSTWTIGRLLDFYDAHHAAEHVTDRERLHYAAIPIRAHFGAMGVDEIDDVELVRYSSGRRRGDYGRKVADSTIRRELQHLRAVLRFAARNTRRTGVRPDDVPPFTMPAAAEPRNLVLTDEQMDAMMRVAQRGEDKLTPGYIFMALARWTAARRTAIEDLTWDRVDFVAGRIEYREPGRRRTKKRRVPVPIDPALRPILERAYAERDPDDPYVVPGGVSTRKSRSTAARRAGVPDATAHTFRHTWATRAALRGVAPAAIAAMMGDSIATVLRNYVHVSEADLAAALGGQATDAVAAK